MLYIITFLISLAIILLTTPLLIKLARRFNFLDYPSALKIHSNPTPLLGGLAVFIGFWVALFTSTLALELPLDFDLLGLLLGASLIVGIGLADDKKGLSPSYKLLGQIIAALVFLIVSQNTKILTGSGWDILILVLWIVGLMNAVNYLDAMDGLCGGISFISAGAFLVIAFFDHQTYSIILALALMGSLLGFLKYNWTPAKIFLGDAGSMFNGFVLACLGILFARENTSYTSLLVPIIILSYPIFDISFVTLIRLREGRKIYVGDYNNSPQRIASLGMQNIGVVLWIYLFCFLLGGLGILLHFFFDSPVRMLITVFVWLFLVIFGVHLQRNFVNIREKLLLVLSDMIMINSVFLFFFWVRFHSGLFSNQWGIPLSEYTAPVIWITIFWINLFAVLGLYEVPGDMRFKDETMGVFKAVAVGIALFLVLTFDPAYLFIKTWILLLIYALSLTVAVSSGRGLFAILTRKLGGLRLAFRKAIIVGTGNEAQSLFRKLSENPGYGYRVIGFVEMYGGHPVPVSLQQEAQILGSREDLDEIARERKIQDILIAVEPDWKGSLQEIMNSVHNLEISFKIISSLRDLTRRYHTTPLRTSFLRRIFPSQMRSWEWLVKRTFDGLVSFVILVLFSPFFLLIALLIRSKFKDRPLVKRTFMGKAGRLLEVYCFRTSEGNPSESSAEISSGNDLGWGMRFLKKTGLEKAPILINILKGQMSLIGPELLSRETFHKLSNSLVLLPKRLDIKPGLISLAKIKTGTKNFAEAAGDNLREDLFYMENMSLLLDLRIIAMRLVSLFGR